MEIKTQYFYHSQNRPLFHLWEIERFHQIFSELALHVPVKCCVRANAVQNSRILGSQGALCGGP